MQRMRASIAITSAAILFGALGTAIGQADAPVGGLYVDWANPVCTDSGVGSQASPFCSLQHAANVVVPGQTVHIVGQDYERPVVLSRSGTADAPIHFVGVGQVDVYPAASQGSSAGSAMINFSGVQYVDLEHVTLHPQTVGGVSVVGAQHVGLEAVTVYGPDPTYTTGSTSADGVDIDGTSAEVSVAHSVIGGTTGDAVRIAPGASHVTVASSTLTATGAGVRADGAEDLELAGDTVSYTGGGIAVTGVSSGSVENTVVMPRAASVNGQAPISVSAEAATGFSEDYNSVTPDLSGLDYQWSGAAYTSTSTFYAATGKGQHDLDSVRGSNPYPLAGSPLIDSGDADAPGESATDVHGQPRTDDPQVVNTGTGDGYTDRGSVEVQAPFALSPVTVSIDRGAAPLAVTASTGVVANSWGEGVSYSFDFGDGSTPVTTSSPTAAHLYTTTASSPYTVVVTATLSDGSQHTVSDNQAVMVSPPAPLTAMVLAGAAPNDVAQLFVHSESPWSISSVHMDFGDGSPSVMAAGTMNYSINHTYPHPGAYTTTTTVTDTGGRPRWYRTRWLSAHKWCRSPCSACSIPGPEPAPPSGPWVPAASSASRSQGRARCQPPV